MKNQSNTIFNLNFLITSLRGAIKKTEIKLKEQIEEIEVLKVKHGKWEKEVGRIHVANIEIRSNLAKALLVIEEKDNQNRKAKQQIRLLEKENQDLRSAIFPISFEWNATNKKRIELIVKMVNKTISTEEKNELDELQHLADCRIELFAPVVIVGEPEFNSSRINELKNINHSLTNDLAKLESQRDLLIQQKESAITSNEYHAQKLAIADKIIRTLIGLTDIGQFHSSTKDLIDKYHAFEYLGKDKESI